MSNHSQQERRQFGRRETRLHAVVLVPGRNPVHCIVTNLSEQGAHLALNEKVALPAVIRVRIDSMGVEYLCNVRHRSPQGTGVVFVDQATADAIMSKAEVSTQRQRLLNKVAPPTVSGAQLRQEVQAARDGDALPADMRALDLAPGRVIRGL